MGMYRDSNWDVPDPGSQGGPVASKLGMHCASCGWRVADRSAVRAVRAAIDHATSTGHLITHDGIVQEWSIAAAKLWKGAA